MVRQVEPYLSVNWLEKTGSANREAQLRLVKQCLASKRKLGANSVFGILNLKTAFDYVKKHIQRDLTAHHEPEDADPSHSGIYGYVFEDQVVADLLAQVCAEQHAVKVL